MATTTNYGWTTPDDTALVKDGAAAIRTLGTAIDTTTFNNAAAAIPKSLVDAAGDLLIGTADNTVGKLAIGTASQQLRVNSGATSLEYFTPTTSGGMTLISTTAFTGSTVTISSIPNTYKNLLLITKGTYGSTNVDESLRFNSDSGNNYAYHNCNVNTTSVSGGGANAQPEIGIGQRTALTDTQQLGYSVINIYRYTDTGGVQMTMAKYSATSGAQLVFFTTNAVYYGASAISSISFLGTGGTYSGGNAYLYGVN